MGRQFFLDMNAFFASVEQQERPELRDRPIIIVPMADVESTCAIAASYEAKRFGITTGTGVKAAKKLCPNVRIVPARPELYLQYHQHITTVLQQHFVSIKPLSVDEMSCTISRLHATPEEEERLARAVKQDIPKACGPLMRCSVGIAPNIFLAKVASDRQKPDGLTIWNRNHLPFVLYDLNLLDLPGIANRMLVRLNLHGITTVRQLYEADQLMLKRAWGGVVGSRWWYMLRGSLEADYGMFIGGDRKSVGHSHVMPPEFRDREGTIKIALRLMSKATARLREYRQVASAVEVRIDYRHLRVPKWTSWRKRSSKHLHANDDLTWQKIMLRLLNAMPEERTSYEALRVSVTFSHLIRERDQTPSLFAEEEGKQEALATIVDSLKSKGCKVDRGSVFWMQAQAPKRIPFGPPQ